MTIKRKSFTLIELLVTIAIIGILSSFGTVQVNAFQQKTRNTQRAASITALQGAMEKYYRANGRYPHPTLDSSCITSDTGVYSCNNTSCDNDNAGHVCTWSSVNSDCKITYDNSWPGLAAYLSPYLNGPMPNDPINPLVSGNSKWGWGVFVSGPEDNHQHYMIQANLEAAGSNKTYADTNAILGPVKLQSNPYGYNYVAWIHFYSNKGTSSMAPTTLNQTCYSNSTNFPTVLDGQTCGTRDFSGTKYYLLCLGNIWKKPVWQNWSPTGWPVDQGNCDKRGWFEQKLQDPTTSCWNSNQL